MQRTIKISLSATVAVLVAQNFGLQNPYSAGIIAILSVLDTVSASIQTALSRVWSMVLAFIVASLVFTVMDYTVIAFGVYLAIYVPLAYKLKAVAGIAPCSVLVTHFIGAESIHWHWQLNGAALLVIGAGTALVLNAWTPSQNKEIERYKKGLENEMRLALHLMGKRIIDPEMKSRSINLSLKQLGQTIEEIRGLSLQEYDNQVFSKERTHLNYIQMRKEQYQIMMRMADALNHIKLNTQQNQLLSRLFTQTADQLDEQNPGVDLLDSIQELFKIYRGSQLPQTREEFESRAVLYQLLIEFEDFLELKLDYYKKLNSQEKNE